MKAATYNQFPLKQARLSSEKYVGNFSHKTTNQEINISSKWPSTLPVSLRTRIRTIPVVNDTWNIRERTLSWQFFASILYFVFLLRRPRIAGSHLFISWFQARARAQWDRGRGWQGWRFDTRDTCWSSSLTSTVWGYSGSPPPPPHHNSSQEGENVAHASFQSFYRSTADKTASFSPSGAFLIIVFSSFQFLLLFIFRLLSILIIFNWVSFTSVSKQEVYISIEY